MTRAYVLDANALLAFLNDETGADRIERLLTDALRNNSPLLVSVVNWGEAFYVLWQRRGEEPTKRLMFSLSQAPFQLVPADMPHITKAAEIKAVHNIPYADAIAAALAEIRTATLVTSDRDFEKLGRRIQVLWLRR